MKKLTLLLSMLLGVANSVFADISVQTKVFDGNSQPPIVGGIINGYSDGVVVKKGVLVSINEDNLVYDAQHEASNPHFLEDLTFEENTENTYFSKDFRIIDCSHLGKEQFWCTLLMLSSGKNYYVKAYAINEDGVVIYGQTESLSSKIFNRYNGRADYANVWHAFNYTLFDLVTDEIIDPNDGFYYSTNENPTTVRHQVGTSHNTCYKFASEWNYKLWYYHSGHCDRQKMVCVPLMEYKDGKLVIEKNPLDADKDVSIYYSINGNYFRPETYTDEYTNPIEITEPCAVYCYAISTEGYISYTNMYVVSSDLIENEGDKDEISDISVQTKIFDGNLQPPIVGGLINSYSADAIVKKGIIVSSSIGGAIYKEDEYWYNASYYSDDSKSVDSDLNLMEIKDYRILDCTFVGEEQFWCSLKLLKPNCDYYVRAFVINKDETVSLGNIEKLHTKSFDRYNGKSDYANVWYAFDYTLFDLITDEIIDPNDGFYYSTNENPTTVRHQVGTSYNTCYKFATEWNYKLWYYHNANHSDINKMTNPPIMSYSNGKLSIKKNPHDADKDITIYYSINGNYFRPETYVNPYTTPLEIAEPCAVYCYAISSDGYISYTNMYVIDGYTIANEDDNDNLDYIEVCGIKWAKGNLQYDAANGGTESFQRNWRIAPTQWHFFHYDEGVSSYETKKTDQQIDHFTWGVCGNWDFLNDVSIYSTANNTDINSKLYLDEDCRTETSVFENAKYGDIAYWASKGQYRLPTVDEVDVLINEASYQYGYFVTDEGTRVYGLLFKTPNPNRITNKNEIQITEQDLTNGLFLPIAGASHTKRTIVEEIFTYGKYWTSNAEQYPQTMVIENFPYRGKYNSYYGQWRSDLATIRPVYIGIIEGLTPNNDGEVDYGNGDIDETTDLNGNVIGNIFYNISDDNGEYSSTEGCIILKKPTSDSDMADLESQDIFGEDFKTGFTGIVFMVQGSGKIRINAETTGNMTLKVKIGNNAPITIELEGKIKASFPYSITEPTYVYIYGGETQTANARGMRAASNESSLKIYGIGWSEATSVESVHNNTNSNAIIYNLQGQRMQTVTKGINIINGMKVIVK